MLTKLIGGLDFGESPRWHEGRLWYSDFHQRAVYAVSLDGHREVVHGGLNDQPSGLGWLPDGTLLVVAMNDRKLLREETGRLVEHADLSRVATGECNDMVVDAKGNAYVGNFGFHYGGGKQPPTADLALVRPHGSVSVAASGLRFPNGSVITPDGGTLIVGETFGGGFEAFTVADDATLGQRRRWADTPGSGPDGCTLDDEGAIWFADAFGSQVIRIREGGEIAHRFPTPMPGFACMLGGDEGRTLFVMCALGSMPEEVARRAGGAIYTTTVDVPHAGRP